jgi:hypothetical protein
MPITREIGFGAAARTGPVKARRTTKIRQLGKHFPHMSRRDKQVLCQIVIAGKPGMALTRKAVDNSNQEFLGRRKIFSGPQPGANPDALKLTMRGVLAIPSQGRS